MSEDELLAPVAAVAAKEAVSRSLPDARVEPLPIVATSTVESAGTASAPLGLGAGLQIDLTRVAGRAAIGAVFAVIVGELWTIVERHGEPDAVAAASVGYAAAMVTAMVAGLVLAEGLWPSVRVPDGRLYLSVGGNRRAAAVIQGAIMGATVGAVVTMLVDGVFDPVPYALFEGVVVALGFLVAEVLLDRIVKRRSGTPTKT